MTESKSATAMGQAGPALPALGMFLLLLAMTAGCFHIPKIIVLQDPLSAAEHLDLGVAYEHSGELDPAAREYEAALRKDNGLFQARVNLGNVWLAKKEYAKARSEYSRALELRPGDAEATNNLAWAAIDSGGGIEEALARMQGVVAMPAGRQPIFLDTLGVLQMTVNCPQEAEQAFLLAERLCNGAADASGQPRCAEDVRQEIQAHRRELTRRFPSPEASEVHSPR